MPSWLGKLYEKNLDFRVTSKYVPYKTYVFLHDVYAKIRNGLKDTLVDHMPSLYIKLRKMKHKKKAKG